MFQFSFSNSFPLVDFSNVPGGCDAYFSFKWIKNSKKMGSSKGRGEEEQEGMEGLRCGGREKGGRLCSELVMMKVIFYFYFCFLFFYFFIVFNSFFLRLFHFFFFLKANIGNFSSHTHLCETKGGCVRSMSFLLYFFFVSFFYSPFLSFFIFTFSLTFLFLFFFFQQLQI